MKDLQIKIMWAIQTIRDQLQFGLDPLSAAKARERRAKGVLLDCHKKLELFQSENSELKSENQELKEKVKDIVTLKEANTYLLSENSTLHVKLQELESQIEKMKNCDNCKNKPLDSDFQDSYNSGYFDPYCTKCIKFSNWELK